MRPMWIPHVLYEALPLMYIAAGVLQLAVRVLHRTGPRATAARARRRLPDGRARRVDAAPRLSRQPGRIPPPPAGLSLLPPCDPAAVYPSRSPRVEGRCTAEDGAPHVLSAHAERSLVSRNRRGGLRSECPRRLPAHAEASSRLGYTASTRRLVIPPRHRRAGGHCGLGEPAFGPGVSWAATTSHLPQVDVADHSRSHDSATIPRYRRRRGVLRQDVRGTNLQPCIDPRSWLRPSEAPGPSAGDAASHRGRAPAGRVFPSGPRPSTC